MVFLNCTIPKWQEAADHSRTAFLVSPKLFSSRGSTRRTRHSREGWRAWQGCKHQQWLYMWHIFIHLGWAWDRWCGNCVFKIGQEKYVFKIGHERHVFKIGQEKCVFKIGQETYGFKIGQESNRTGETCVRNMCEKHVWETCVRNKCEKHVFHACAPELIIHIVTNLYACTHNKYTGLLTSMR